MLNATVYLFRFLYAMLSEHIFFVLLGSRSFSGWRILMHFFTFAECYLSSNEKFYSVMENTEHVVYF
ncbi:hypothetical protein RB195_006433 [Necator americanus]|uniref:Uncharacterized protein n=1 Tax=Necator americanus TaxID=51031 RepID=A0ABR1BSL6_NECAM